MSKRKSREAIKFTSDLENKAETILLMFESSTLMGPSQAATAVDHYLKSRIQFDCDSRFFKVDGSEEQKINEAGIFIC